MIAVTALTADWASHWSRLRSCKSTLEGATDRCWVSREPAPPPGGARSGRSSARPSRRWPKESNRARPSPPPRRFRPGGSAQDVVKGELSPGHKTHACDERPKDPQARYKARQEDRSPSVPLEKPFGASQALGRDKGVPTPPQHKRAPAEATDTIAYLSSHNGSEAAQHHCFP